jgi:hypothetical protein
MVLMELARLGSQINIKKVIHGIHTKARIEQLVRMNVNPFQAL